MSDFVPGQRWVVDAEPELGLGLVLAVDNRAVTLSFPQAGCERLYAAQRAPLTRLVFDVNDEIHLVDGRQGKVVAVHEHAGLMFYDTGGEQLVPEQALASEIKMNQPFLRLLTGQLDKPKWFAFRRALDHAMAKTWQSGLPGFLGIRANLIAHQLYVAWAACDREQVRVLLADEVGLGKTIEAGMIMARLLHFERVQRVLIVVPDALQAQWLVELVRRFNFRPTLYTGIEHDFQLDQIQLVPHSLMHSDDALSLAAEDFDLVIVDEAHHLQPSSDAFERLRELSMVSPHLVLLSATPEQLGFESHFARLQLLDSAKFQDIDEFVKQEETYAELNQQIRQLPESRPALIKQFDLDGGQTDQQLINELLDCHGIGRVMFRNTRAAISGFPARSAVPHELANDDWSDKFEWLAQWAKQHPREKALVICHDVEDVKSCETYLWQKHGVDAALFHEGMDLIERDRAAAYFADHDEGSQLLVCSEIGSEGRNFQFCQHLICLDLPEHPDLLEQRIGRLDRIGQTGDVQVHVPFAEGSTTGERFHWFHDVLQCIDRQSPAAGPVHDEFWPQLEHTPEDEPLRQEAHKKLLVLQEEIQAGRDALLEMNSCRQPQADQLVTQVSEFEADTPLALVEQASELLNFHFEATRTGAYSLIPADNMMVPALPGIPPEGAEVTFLRSLANSREDLLFLTWDAPFIVGLWEMLHHSDVGSASVALLPSRQLPAGQCLLEACFDVVIQAPNTRVCLPFLADLSIRALTLDISPNDLSASLPEYSFEQSLRSVDKKLARKIIQSRKEELPQWYHKVETFAVARKEALIQQALDNARDYFANEIGRLRKLAQRNPSIANDDVLALEAKAEAVANSLQHNCVLQLSAVRLVVTTES